MGYYRTSVVIGQFELPTILVQFLVRFGALFRILIIVTLVLFTLNQVLTAKVRLVRSNRSLK